MRIVLLFAAILALSGCAHMKRQKIAQQMQADSAAMKAQCALVFQDPAVQPLRDLIPSSVEHPSLEQLANKAVPDDQQKAALSAMEKIKQPCVNSQRAFLSRYYGEEVANAYDTYQRQSSFLTAELWSGRTTYGQYNADRQRYFGEMRSHAADIAERNRQQAQAADEARKNAILQGLMARPAYQPPPVPVYTVPTPTYTAPRMRTTTCTPGLGGTMTCNSY